MPYSSFPLAVLHGSGYSQCCCLNPCHLSPLPAVSTSPFPTVCVYSHPANRFLCTIFLDSICMRNIIVYMRGPQAVMDLVPLEGSRDCWQGIPSSWILGSWSPAGVYLAPRRAPRSVGPPQGIPKRLLPGASSGNHPREMNYLCFAFFPQSS